MRRPAASTGTTSVGQREPLGRAVGHSHWSRATVSCVSASGKSPPDKNKPLWCRCVRPSPRRRQTPNIMASQVATACRHAFSGQTGYRLNMTIPSRVAATFTPVGSSVLFGLTVKSGNSAQRSVFFGSSFAQKRTSVLFVPHPSSSARALSSAAPSPFHAEPCIQARVLGPVPASFSNKTRAWRVCEK